jgi:hypothetical protein
MDGQYCKKTFGLGIWPLGIGRGTWGHASGCGPELHPSSPLRFAAICPAVCGDVTDFSSPNKQTSIRVYFASSVIRDPILPRVSMKHPTSSLQYRLRTHMYSTRLGGCRLHAATCGCSPNRRRKFPNAKRARQDQTRRYPLACTSTPLYPHALELWNFPTLAPSPSTWHHAREREGLDGLRPDPANSPCGDLIPVAQLVP